ncbi:SIS domain-containing protein [Acaryochloris sp. IP29b_bin.137]|uniref:SIS domain-containing protein n=1 Tax=Acaryochloris sp. IP29b_bin.137 TaxID=2969217 RepID=UPI00263A259A|nr:SIS domain-containing protein [Acaryochloris sp. IP29b_bin.137]
MTYWSDVQEQPQILHALIQTYQQSQVWSQLIADSGLIVLSGMGASYNALYPAWFYLNQQGRTALHLETSTLIHYLPSLLGTCEVMVVVSQSGESIEIKKLVEQLETRRRQDLKTPVLISVTNSAQNTLANYGDISLPTHAGAEVGIATKTYTSSMLMLNFVAKALVGQLQSQDFETGTAIATLCQDWLDKKTASVEAAFEAFQAITYMALIGRGPALATAHNGALIFKEGVRLPAEGYSGGQFRHGPREMISADLGLLVLTSPDATLDLNLRLAADILDYGGRLVCIGQPGSPAGVSIALPSAIDSLYYPILEILPIQLLAARLASDRNLEPGVFRWSGKVVDQE